MFSPVREAMKAIVITAITAALAVAPAIRAQNAVEYGSLANPSVAASGISKSVSRRAEQLSTKIAAGTKDTSKGVATQEKNVQAKSESASKPTPPAVFILSNGDRIESSRYLLTANSLRVQQGEAQRTIPLRAVNMDATIAANRERGINLKFPKNTGEITLSF
jgi:hypothetical protein